MERKISDYSLIGNSCAAALVSKYGSIDWCCLPEFDSPAIFAALLDKQKGGFFSIAPSDVSISQQAYETETNVLRTNFKTDEGSVSLTDAFTAIPEQERMLSLLPDHEILRIVHGISGVVKMKLQFCPRIFYGKKLPRLTHRGKLGIHLSWNENVLVLVGTLEPGEIKLDIRKAAAMAEFDVSEGQTVIFSLSYSNQSPAVIPELRETATGRMQTTLTYWRNWITRCAYDGVYAEQVKRSVLALKLLAHAPSGSIVAAPTTSLPETEGGERNWDYRYCWLRDASFTTRALVDLGFEEEAHAYMNWILHATRLTRPRLQVVYSTYGHANLKEKTLDWLSGYRNSRPVRVGNRADTQFQLDVYGEVLDAVFSYAPLVKRFDDNSRKFIIGIGNVICKLWRQPDNGIWEIRSSLVHHTHSKVMAWAGLDRLIKLSRRYEWRDSPVDKFSATADMIRNEIERSGYNAQLNSYTRTLDDDSVDASLLTLPLVGYCDFSSERMMSTVRLIRARLSTHNLTYRYHRIDDGLEDGEGAFVICNFWLAENLARSGKLEEAVEVFETTLNHASPTGLLSEEIDTGTHDLLGNYPQGFSHVGLINAARSIDEVRKIKSHRR